MLLLVHECRWLPDASGIGCDVASIDIVGGRVRKGVAPDVQMAAVRWDVGRKVPTRAIMRQCEVKSTVDMSAKSMSLDMLAYGVTKSRTFVLLQSTFGLT